VLATCMIGKLAQINVCCTTDLLLTASAVPLPLGCHAGLKRIYFKRRPLLPRLPHPCRQSFTAGQGFLQNVASCLKQR